MAVLNAYEDSNTRTISKRQDSRRTGDYLKTERTSTRDQTLEVKITEAGWNMATVPDVVVEVQLPGLEVAAVNSGLTQPDRRALLGAALRLFLHRIRHNQPVHKRELLDLVACGDDDLEAAA